MIDSTGGVAELLECMCTSREQYKARMDGGIYEKIEDVPSQYRFLFDEKRSDGVTRYNRKEMFERGKEWVIEPLRTLQPHSFAAFQEVVGPLKLGIVLIQGPSNRNDPPDPQPILFFDASGYMVEVQANFPGDTYENGNDSFGSLLSLPDALAKSWLWRTNGWRMPRGTFEGPLVNRRLIGHPSDQWQSIDKLLASYNRQWKKKLWPKIEHRFPDAVVTKYNPHDGSPYKKTSMRCFLDARPSGVGGPVGDQFLVFSEKRDQVVYHIHHGDIDNIRVLRDPADAIDRYCAHVLRRMPGEFDFSPWSEPLSR